IDYGSGNVHSAQKALERAAREAGLATDVKLTADPDTVARADRIVLPGVGAFADCRDGLLKVDGLWDALDAAVRVRATPFLGICVGMQLAARRGLEFGETDGFGWIDADVSALQPADAALKIPHMGWNTLTLHRRHALFEGIKTGPDGLHAYFVHSFHMANAPADTLIATADYSGDVTAAVARDTLFATQFHPEKSQTLGLALLANFLRWSP
ncbi:MAG: imidazole glycerol phosphate synthase subunit HisH, partial [Pseudomonadota bacterium]